MWQVITGDYYNCPYPFRWARTPRRVQLCARAGGVSTAIRPVAVIIGDRFARMPRATPTVAAMRPDLVNVLVTRRCREGCGRAYVSRVGKLIMWSGEGSDAAAGRMVGKDTAGRGPGVVGSA